MQLRDYFKRIGWSGAITPTLESLGALLHTHNHNVPFENLDVQLGNPLTTSVEEAYDKIVNGNRGGWCYAQNGLFGWALSKIGFDVRRIAASVMRADNGHTSNANHLALLVSLPNDDTRWLVDVGFGGSLLRPIQLATGKHYHAPFAVGLRTLEDGHWQFWESIGKNEFSFDFEDIPADEHAMAARCHHLQTSLDSSFVQNFVCQMRRPDSHITLRGRVFSVVTSESRRKQVLESANEFVAILRNEFRLIAPEAANLWGKICQRHEQLEDQNQRQSNE